MKKNLFFSFVITLVLLLTMVLIQPHTALAQDPYYTGTLTLVDEAGNPLANYPADYPGETRNLKWKYRCGGSWSPTTSFQTDASGQFPIDIGCDNWDKKITVTLNQTSLEQDVTVNPIFQAAKVNANLKSCTGPITGTPGGVVDQGGGYWYTQGTTGPAGTVTFYTFPGNVKLRMSYNHNSQTVFPTIVAGVNEVDFQTTKVTTTYAGDIKSNKGGWWFFSKPSMDLLPGDYPFYFKTDPTWDGPITISVSGCEMSLPYGDTNSPPVCEGALASSSLLWPPNHQMVGVDVLGVTDPDGDPVSLTINSIYQDEPVDATGDGAFAPDGMGVGTSTALLRAERDGGGNGRFYYVGFTADDGNGGTCTGTIAVNVPKSMGKKGAAVDDGALFDSTIP